HGDAVSAGQYAALVEAYRGFVAVLGGMAPRGLGALGEIGIDHREPHAARAVVRDDALDLGRERVGDRTVAGDEEEDAGAVLARTRGGAAGAEEQQREGQGSHVRGVDRRWARKVRLHLDV